MGERYQLLANVPGFAGYGEVQSIALALLGTDLNFFFPSPSLTERSSW